MKGRQSGFLLLGSLAVGLVIGLLAGGTGSGGTPDDVLPSKAPPRPLGKSERDHVRAGVRAIMNGPRGKEQMRAMIELADSIPLGEIETWLDKIYLDTADAWIDAVCIEILNTRLFEADPEHFLQRCIRLDQKHGAEYMARWTRADPDAAEAFALGLAASDRKRELTDTVIGELALLQPIHAIDLITKFGTDIKAGRDLTKTFAELAKTHRAELLEALRSWPPAIGKLALGQVAVQYSREDLDGALQWMAGEEKGRNLFVQLCQLDRSIAPGLLGKADELPDGWLNAAVSQSWYALPREDPMMWMTVDAESLRVEPEALHQLQLFAARLLGVTAENRAEVMALLDLDSGLAPNTRQALVGAITGGWLGEDREAAERWVAGLEDETLREVGLGKINKPEETGAEPPPPAGELVRRLSSDAVAQGGNPFLSQIRNWTASDLAEGRASFREMPQEARDRAARIMTEQSNWQVIPSIRSEAWGHLIATGSTAGLSEREFLGRVSETAARWGRADPAAAAEWVTSLPPGPAREWAGRNVARQWASHSEHEARGWIEGLDHPEERAMLLDVLNGEE